MAEPVTILLYGPRLLRYAPDARVRELLGVEVAEPPELVPLPPAPETPREPEPVRLPPPPDRGEIFYYRRSDLVNREPSVVQFEATRFQPIEHQGVVFVIEAASELPPETFAVARTRAEELGVTVLPLYVRRLLN